MCAPARSNTVCRRGCVCTPPRRSPCAPLLTSKVRTQDLIEGSLHSQHHPADLFEVSKFHPVAIAHADPPIVVRRRSLPRPRSRSGQSLAEPAPPPVPCSRLSHRPRPARPHPGAVLRPQAAALLRGHEDVSHEQRDTVLASNVVLAPAAAHAREHRAPLALQPAPAAAAEEHRVGVLGQRRRGHAHDADLGRARDGRRRVPRARAREHEEGRAKRGCQGGPREARDRCPVSGPACLCGRNIER